MRIVKLGNGHLKLDSEKAEMFLDKLIDEDKLWAYLSLLFNDSINNSNATKAEPDIKGESLEEVKDMMSKMMDAMSVMSKQIQEKGVAVVQSSKEVEHEVAATNVEVVEENKVPKKRKSKPKKAIGGFGSLDSLASKFNKSDRI